ncbi:hypothetical protein R8Z57_15520 [Microbacterium sp. M3]|uniref:SbsA Ig-like domain-containing protein n=1 Tax=Microbacterium arthrosphaerae TaxID=792652 RepID=A0ABU4H8I7_9MICO|nr:MULTISPECIES: hypothetical protein [Microbacterium]MDW4574189.1 hypothetical protein [Microbacterium arthrosphaerae]MDW7608044.1 hypothetical protein [Microbacterium sp. M3]
MSTDGATRRGRSRRRRGRAFAGAFAIVVGVLAIIGLAGAAASVAQGPRVSQVSVDPAAAAAASGSRLIVTTTQTLAEVDASQVTITPATPFAVDTSGRSLGVRFTLPLWDDTEYTVTIDDVASLGGGPTATITETFRTPPAEVFLLQRDTPSGDDLIYRSDLTGQNAVAVFRHPHIEDFRATADHLVVSVRTDDDLPGLLVTDLDGGDEHELPLPVEDGADGYLSNLQSADRGERIGYTFSDAELDADTGRESRLFTASLGEPDAEPTPIEVEGADPRVAEWRFVPDTDSILLLSFDGSLLLTGSGADTSATALGAAIAIDGIARGSSETVVDRLEQSAVIDLTDASEAPLVAPDVELGGTTSVTPLPDGSTIRTAAVLDAGGVPTGRTSVALVDADGATSMLTEIPETDAVIQVCVSPSSRYVAVMVAPDAVSNPYDTYQLPLPEKPETRILEVAGGEPVVALNGSSISWCQVPPR